MKIENSIALVTGANRGLGRAFVTHLLERGASKVYATSRHAAALDLPNVVPLDLDITDPQQVQAAADRAPDVNLLINNAGISTWENLIDGDLDGIRREMDTHFYGTLNMVRAFAPVLGRNGGGAVVNMMSAVSWFAVNDNNAYHAAKAAEWALTNGIRLELAAQGTLVTGVHLGLADTDMAAAFDVEKLAPSVVTAGVLDGVEARSFEVLLDDWTRTVKASLAGDPAAFYSDLD